MSSHQSDKQKQLHATDGKGGKLVAQSTEVFRGPLPNPDHLAKYEEICPGLADRIVKMAENQAAHRQSIEKKVIASQTRDSFLGVIFAFLLGCTTIVAGTIITLNGYTFAGFSFGAAGLGGIVISFIYGTRSNRREREDKNEKSKRPR